MVRNRLTWKITLFAASLLVIAFAGMWWLKISTYYGLGLVNDSSAYVGGAVNMLQGDGYSRISGDGEVSPITHFPPMVSIILALIGLTKVNLLFAARLLALLLYGFNAMLVGISLLVITRRYLISLVGAGLFATSSIFLQVYSMLMSEPLFITFGLLSSLSLFIFFRHKAKRWLFIAGLLAGCAALTRYAGLSLFLTAVLTLALLRRQLKTILLEVLIYLSGALPLNLVWSMRNFLLSGTVANRQFLWHPPAWSKLQIGIFNFLDWLLPDRILTWLQAQEWAAVGLAGIVSLAFLSFVIYICIHLYRRSPSDRLVEAGESLLVYNLIYVIAYIASILAAMTFFDASTPFENRILAPAEVSFLIAALAVTARWIENHGFALRASIIAVLLIFTLFWVQDGRQAVQVLGNDGQGFASLYWQNSPTIEYIRNLPPDKLIYTNKSTGVFLLTGRNASRILSRTDPVTLKPRQDYEAELEKLHNDVRSGKAVLIFFEADQQVEPADVAWLEDLRSGMTLYKKFLDSEVYDH